MLGKFVLVVIPSYADAYLSQHLGLRGALMFVSEQSLDGDPAVVFVEPADSALDHAGVGGDAWMWGERLGAWMRDCLPQP
jgi:hypothetical protein